MYFIQIFTTKKYFLNLFFKAFKIQFKKKMFSYILMKKLKALIFPFFSPKNYVYFQEMKFKKRKEFQMPAFSYNGKNLRKEHVFW